LDILARELASIHARWAPVEVRAAAILSNIRLSCRDLLHGESYNQANERQVEDFIARLREEFPGRTYEVERGGRQDTPQVFSRRWDHARHRRDAPCVVIERQKLSPWALRTTRWNFIFTVPGESPEIFLLVAHYDTWRGPGADDNTTGEEILKQYLLADLHSPERPQLTHVYFLAGSEECGLVGLLSQFLLAGGLMAATQAFQGGSWVYLAVAVALCPLAGYRFGVSGSREYVRALSPEELRQILAVISVDSVGEGRMFIPRSTLGADFLRALIPFGDYDSFSDLLEEAAHLHGIKYNNYIAGGTTDHVSFLEVNNGFWARARDAAQRAWAWLSKRDYQPPRRIPASALVTMLPGKASPLVFGGKIHTPQDVPERVYPEPVQEALLILDYVFHVLEGGTPVLEPRELDRFHYARLYAIGDPEEATSEYWLVLKDALEPNRRNLNAIYTVENARVDEAGKEGWVRAGLPLTWGVHTRLRDEVRDLCTKAGREYYRVHLNRLTVTDGQREFPFARKLSLTDQIRRRYYRAQAWMGRQVGRYSFFAFFALAWGISEAVTHALAPAFMWSYAFQSWFFKYEIVTLPVVLLLQIGLLMWFMVRLIPAWIDNHYKYENRADNMGSLRRQRLEVPSA
jgi:hypothetical protein